MLNRGKGLCEDEPTGSLQLKQSLGPDFPTSPFLASRDKNQAVIDRNKRVVHGGASRDRTDDLIVANDALSQLSYSPTGREGSLLF